MAVTRVRRGRRRDVGGVDYTPRHGEGKVCRRTVRAALARARLRGRAPRGQDATGLLSAAGTTRYRASAGAPRVCRVVVVPKVA